MTENHSSEMSETDFLAYLFAQHRDDLMRYASGIVGRDLDQANELVAMTFYSACNSVASIDRDRNPVRWLKRVLKNHSVDLYRRRRIEAAHVARMAAPASSISDEYDLADAQEDLPIYLQRLAEKSPTFQKRLLDAFVENGLSRDGLPEIISVSEDYLRRLFQIAKAEVTSEHQKCVLSVLTSKKSIEVRAKKHARTSNYSEAARAQRPSSPKEKVVKIVEVQQQSISPIQMRWFTLHEYCERKCVSELDSVNWMDPACFLFDDYCWRLLRTADWINHMEGIGYNLIFEMSRRYHERMDKRGWVLTADEQSRDMRRMGDEEESEIRKLFDRLIEGLRKYDAIHLKYSPQALAGGHA